MPVYRYANAGSMSATVSEGGLAAGAHKYRVVARISTNAPTNAVSVDFYGEVKLVSPT